MHFIILFIFFHSDLKTLTNGFGCGIGDKYLIYTETRFLLPSLPCSVIIHSMVNKKGAYFQSELAFSDEDAQN